MAYSQQTQVKNKLFNIPQFTQSISQYQENLSSLQPEQKRQILRGRYQNEYKQLISCQNHQFDTKKLDCFKQTLHSFCLNEFNTFLECLKINKNKKQCDQVIGQYFICVDRKMKNLYWSGSILLIEQKVKQNKNKILNDDFYKVGDFILSYLT